jgi:hypothetical protein
MIAQVPRPGASFRAGSGLPAALDVADPNGQ